MGKKSKTKYPTFAGGNVTIDGRNVASASNNNGVISTSYNMSDAERKIYNSVQDNLGSSLKNLFSISEPQRREWTNKLNVMKNEGIEQIDSIYKPMENDLKNNIASRFGNLDNSAFMDNLNSIVNKRAKAVADLCNNLTLAQDSLYANELNNRMSIINMLNGVNTSMNNNMTNMMNVAKNNSTTGNSYNTTAYQAANSGASGLDFFNSATSGLSKIASSIFSFI